MKLKIITVIVLIITVILSVSSAYASTLGYKSLFFAINNKFKPTNVVANGKKEILSNRDITISYQPIKIAEDLKIQVNRLIVNSNEAKLKLKFEYDESPKNVVEVCYVHDITRYKKENVSGVSTFLAKEEIKNKNGRFEQDITLSGFKDSTNNLEIELQDKEYATIAVLEIDIDKKEIDVVISRESGAKDVQKISETELKEVLSDFARVHFYEDLNAVTKYHTVEEYRNEQLVNIALNHIGNVEKANRKLVHKAIKEICGKEINNYLSLSNIIVAYDRADKEYRFISPGFTGRKALCLDIEDISYKNGIYKVKFIYCYPTEEDYTNNNIENLDGFVGEMEFSINSNYEYSKYKIENIENYKSYKLGSKIGSIGAINIEEKTENSNTVNNTIDVNTISNNTIGKNTVANNTVSTNTIANNAVTNDVVANKTNTIYRNNTIGRNMVTNNISTNTVILPHPNENPYYAGMFWEKFYSVGLRGLMPEGFDIEVYDDFFNGIEDQYKLSTRVIGNVDGDKITIDFYMPRFVENCYSTDEFCKMIAEEYGKKYDGAETLDGKGEMDWGIISFDVTPQTSQTSCYCHFEPSDSSMGVGNMIIVGIESKNISNRTFEVLDNMFQNLEGASF